MGGPGAELPIRDPEYEGYVLMFNRFGRARMSGTYKPVFLRSLLDLGLCGEGGLEGERCVRPAGGTIELGLDFVAMRFLKYYWDMEYSFRIRQAPGRPLAVQSILEGVGGRYRRPPTLRQLAGPGWAAARAAVISRSIKPQVLRYLLTDMGGLYRHLPGTDTIVLDAALAGFLRRYRRVLQSHINFKMARYLEGINPGMPRIASKLGGSPARAHLPRGARALISEGQGRRCFYCGGGYGEEFAIDHVIPFNFIYSTDLYNCVAAHRRCNCEKSDMLPERGLFREVLERNDELAGRRDAARAMEHYDRGWYERQYDHCRAEYHGGRDEVFAPRPR